MTVDRQVYEGAHGLAERAGAADLFAFLGLRPGATAAQARAALAEKRRWAQSMQANPKHAEVARYLIRHHAALVVFAEEPSGYRTWLEALREASVKAKLDEALRAVAESGELDETTTSLLRAASERLRDRGFSPEPAPQASMPPPALPATPRPAPDRATSQDLSSGRHVGVGIVGVGTVLVASGLLVVVVALLLAVWVLWSPAGPTVAPPVEAVLAPLASPVSAPTAAPVAAPEKVAVRLDSEPSGATVSRDGVVLGSTPFTLRLLPDDPAWVIELSHVGYESVKVRLDTSIPEPRIRLSPRIQEAATRPVGRALAPAAPALPAASPAEPPPEVAPEAAEVAADEPGEAPGPEWSTPRLEEVRDPWAHE